MLAEEKENNVAVVLGGHVNAFSVVRELYAQGIKEIAVLGPAKSVAYYSNKVKYRAVIDKTPERLLKELVKLQEKYRYLVVYPTDDLQLENLNAIYDEVIDYCYLPFNPENLAQTSDKFVQYQACERAGIPYPKTVNLTKASDFESVEGLTFPVLVKPSTRKDLTVDVFRTLYLQEPSDFLKQKNMLLSKVAEGVEFVASEYIPGDDTNIYAYTCFRSHEGEILNEWVGKKLTQFPDNYGVVSSASNEAPEIVKEQGRGVVEALDAFGVVEPEFKYDHRDGKFKLMETNLRSMMWNRVGAISGVHLQETQFKYAIGETLPVYSQEVSKKTHLVLMLHEIPNLIARKGYWKHFKHNVWGGQVRCWAIYDSDDIKPFLYSLSLLFKRGLGACLRRLNLR